MLLLHELLSYVYPYITIAYKISLMSVASQMNPTQVAKWLNMGERQLLNVNRHGGFVIAELHR